jgi:decaprenylphospho-beta-D-ribofuranose 2-oxidase
MELTGWGRYPRIKAQGFSFDNPEQLQNYLAGSAECIVYGKGNSYGDSALNHQVIFSNRFNKIIDWQPQTGLVTCESGVCLAELIQVFLPRGWFLPVVPGTRFITLGGAIASDIHGKNHHRVGCFSEFVLAFDLMLPDGQIVECSRRKNRPLFLATCGGMGLTGVILTITLKLQPLQSAYIRETIIKGRNLEEVFVLMEANQEVPYSVAWIDCLSKDEALGRSVLMLGSHADSGPLTLLPDKVFSFPFTAPGMLLNRYSVSWFNQCYYSQKPAYVENRLVHLEDFFFPLDKISNWNRLYGRKGFTQYQLVLPQAASLAGLKKILGEIGESGLGSFLAVLKLFGPENENYLSFPLAGYTLALDFKIEPNLFPLLKRLDQMVLDYGGRLYLTKDVRMSPTVFQQGYPRWREFMELREQYGMQEKFNSLQSKRLGL